MDFPEELVQRLCEASRMVVLTGAGVSQESGLRTFRDSQTGLWKQSRPNDLASPEAFRRDPKLVWDWYAWRREALKSARPNPGHYALAEMERRFSGFTLVTQNVDGLHRMAGNRNVFELHGNLKRVRCSACGTIAETPDHEWDAGNEDVPRCRRCGGLLRPDVVWFGEALPRGILTAAVKAVDSCELFFSIGTSAVVQPAASLAYAAQEHGATLVEINAESTPLTSRADFALRGKSGLVLPELVRAVWGA